MNRNSFLRLTLAAGAIITAPVAALARTISGRTKKGILVKAGSDRFDKPIKLFEGDVFYTKVSGKDSDKGVYIFESTREVKGGPREHIHYDQDEWWYIIEGEFLFKVGDETFTAKPGDHVFGPRMVPHTFAKISEGRAKLIIGYQPAGRMEEYFNAVAAGAAKNLSDSGKDEFRKKHGFEHTGPALVYDKTFLK